MIEEIITQIARTMNVSEAYVGASIDKLINPPQPYVPLQDMETKTAYMETKLTMTKESAMKKETVLPCLEDCFNCIYPDCIFDGLGRETKKGRPPKAAVPEGELTKDQIRGRKYYAAHREEQKAKKYAYYLEHREELNAKKREKYKAQKAAKAEAVNNNSIL